MIMLKLYNCRSNNLHKLLGRSIFELSGGEKQKIACAGVHCMHPDIIVMDEPTSNLDLDAIKELRSIIAEWKADGKTIVIAEHRLDWLKGLCDRVILLETGSITHTFTGVEFFVKSAMEMNAIGLRSSDGLPDYLNFPCGFYATSGKESGGKVLRLNNFRYSYQKKAALDIESLEIPIGAVTAVVGHNGAGKSTFVIVNDINLRTLMSEVCCYADERFYLKVQILMSFTISVFAVCKNISKVRSLSTDCNIIQGK